MERFVLVELGFYLGHVAPEEFLSVYGEIYLLDRPALSLARYLIELAMVHKRFIGVRPSLIARAALNLGCLYTSGNDLLGKSATEQDHICQAHLRDCLRQQPAVLIKKFGGHEYHYASRIVERLDSSSPSTTYPTPPLSMLPNVVSTTTSVMVNGLLTPPKDVLTIPSPPPST
ncbi:hypothetical protein HDU91_002700, partial [Kappamyces sp. JEL0680]